MKEETREKIVKVINKARRLEWVYHDGNNLNMELEDVEKVLVGILEPEYIDNLIRIKSKFDQDVADRAKDAKCTLDESGGKKQ